MSAAESCIRELISLPTGEPMKTIQHSTASCQIGVTPWPAYPRANHTVACDAPRDCTIVCCDSCCEAGPTRRNFRKIDVFWWNTPQFSVGDLITSSLQTAPTQPSLESQQLTWLFPQAVTTGSTQHLYTLQHGALSSELFTDWGHAENWPQILFDRLLNWILSGWKESGDTTQRLCPVSRSSVFPTRCSPGHAGPENHRRIYPGVYVAWSRPIHPSDYNCSCYPHFVPLGRVSAATPVFAE